MIIRPILQSMVEDIDFDRLPTNWSTLDTVSFSKRKRLWNFQQEALKNAIKVLYLYFKEDQMEKEKFYQRYKFNGLNNYLERDLDIEVKKSFLSLLQQYYPIEDGRVKFSDLINRAAFWMATGSGKTLLIVKLVEILKRLIESGEIPKKDILILTYRDDLIDQLKTHIDEFNELAIERGLKINLIELTEYERVRRESLVPFFYEVTVFYYRSDLISDEQKEKKIDFRNYENNGDWYIILDEAHKGDKQDSKRQMFYSIMSRNGFLFNFSATFTDPRDIITTAYNFNLKSFVSEGYGKHIYLLKQELRAFRDKGDDYNKEEKQKIVLKSLLLLTYLKKMREKVKEIAGSIYHEPLMLTLVNTVNLSDVKDEKPDLVMFFEEIERIAKGDIDKGLLEKAKEEILEEFSENPQLVFEDIPIGIDEKAFRDLKVADVLKYVYNADSFGEIEYTLIPGTQKEVVLKLKSTPKSFALIRIGNAVKWVKDNLKSYTYTTTEAFEDKSVFEDLDRKEEISILMGSRSFYEGWDSNRPNIVLFINIGTGREAKKFVIQSVGRGVRIEPIKGERRRLKHLYNERKDRGLFESVGKYSQPLETLFIFGTNRKVLSEIVHTLKVEKGFEETISLLENESTREYTLLIPVFKKSEKRIYEEQLPSKYPLSEYIFDAIKEYFKNTDERVIVIQNNLSPKFVQFIQGSFSDKDKYYKVTREIVNVPILKTIKNMVSYFELNAEELDKFKPLENEIVHFKKVKILLDKEDEINEFKERVHKVTEYPKRQQLEEELGRLYGKLPMKEFTRQLESIEKEYPKEETFRDLKIKYVANHYYVPLILSKKEKVDYIRHIIKTKSEVRFIEDLEDYLEKNSNKINVDWWMFSKIDEYFDDVFIPYYDPDINKLRKFKPDFIFWFDRGNEYTIVFVDPKGVKHTEFEHKVDSFRRFFGNINVPQIFKYGNFRIKVYLYLYTEDRNRISKGYRAYWFDNISKLFSVVGRNDN